MGDDEWKQHSPLLGGSRAKALSGDRLLLLRGNQLLHNVADVVFLMPHVLVVALDKSWKNFDELRNCVLGRRR